MTQGTEFSAMMLKMSHPPTAKIRARMMKSAKKPFMV